MSLFVKWIREKIDSNQNALIVCVGRARHGKSWGVAKLIEELRKEIPDLNFDRNRILYWADDLLNVIENSQKDIIVIDESSHEFDRRRWFSLQNHILTVLNATQGFRQNVMFIITQNRRLISSTAWFMADYYIKFKKWRDYKGDTKYFAKFYYNNENAMADKDPKWMGDAFYSLELTPPNEEMKELFDLKGIEFKRELPGKLREMRKEPQAKNPYSSDIITPYSPNKNPFLIPELQEEDK